MGFLPKILIIWVFAFNPRLFPQPLPHPGPLTFPVSSGGPGRGDRDTLWGQGHALGSAWTSGEGSVWY